MIVILFLPITHILSLSIDEVLTLSIRLVNLWYQQMGEICHNFLFRSVWSDIYVVCLTSHRLQNVTRVCDIYIHWHLTRMYGGFLQFLPKQVTLNTLRLRPNGRHFPDDSFQWIFMNEIVWISCKVSLKFVPWGLIKNITAFVQIMVGHRPVDKPLSEPMMVSLVTHICVTRPQWVKVFHPKLKLWNELISCIMKLKVLCGILPQFQEFSPFYFFLFHQGDEKVSFHNFDHLRKRFVSWLEFENYAI